MPKPKTTKADEAAGDEAGAEPAAPGAGVQPSPEEPAGQQAPPQAPGAPGDAVGTIRLPGREVEPHRATGTRRWQVVAVTEAGKSEHSLPTSGRISVGRGEDADVRIDDGTASRRHAQLIVAGDRVTLRDLGSANGTTARGRRLAANEEVELSEGDAVEVGTSLLVLKRELVADEARPWTLLTHYRFLDEVDDARAPFAVLRLQLVAPPGVAQAVLSTELGPQDKVASFGPGQFEVLALGRGPDEAQALVQRLSARLITAGADRVRAGAASAPRDGTDAEALLAACSRPATAPAPGFIVRDDAMLALGRLVDRVAPSEINVLILGEMGVGKEVLAEQLHRRSKRAQGPLVKLNCGALNEALLESELFGHEKGAFTGAVAQKPGLLEAANGGTVFLDEVGEMPAAMQAKLLRVLEERQVTRVGSVKSEPIDVRFVFATNRDLEAEVARGAFRADLYYRVNGISVVIPPLRERVSEIEALARKFMADTSQRDDVPCPELSAQALETLLAWHWPGNIRELRNVIHRAVLLAGARVIAPAHLQLGPGSSVRPPATGTPALGAQAVTMRSAIEAAEKRMMIDKLKEAGGNHSRAAQLMPWSRRKWTERAKKYGLQKGSLPGLDEPGLTAS